MSAKGRPKAVDAGDVYNNLLAAARRCFSVYSYHAVGIRQIAREAGTTSAMIHHYFGSKRGLYEKLLESYFKPLVNALKQIEQKEEKQIDPVEAHLKNVTRLFSENPWLIRIIVQEVLSEGSHMRNFFIESFIRPIRETFIKLIRERINTGDYRRELDPMLTAISVISTAVFPHILMNVFKNDPEFTVDDDIYFKLMNHNLELFDRAFRKKVEND